MAHFDRFDICEAYLVLEGDWHVGGILWERPSNRRRNMSTDFQLRRMGFKPRPDLSYETLEENGREIYDELERRYRLKEGSDALDR